jgi:hypothetical protein
MAEGLGTSGMQALTDLSLEDAFSEVVKELWDESADVAASGVGMRRKGPSAAPSEAGDGGRSHRHRSHRRSPSSSRSRSPSPSESRRGKRHGRHSRPAHHSPAASERSQLTAPAPQRQEDDVRSNKSSVSAPSRHRPLAALCDMQAVRVALIGTRVWWGSLGAAQEDLLLNIHQLRSAVAAGDGELAARFAYENLRSLAGMSHQIQVRDARGHTALHPLPRPPGGAVEPRGVRRGPRSSDP